jgi:16S rRNA (cytosine1402-N4)-methyltransferase
VHKPVLLSQLIEHLDPAPGDKILDCTVGGGGHAEAILERIGPDGMLIGIDRDERALAEARRNLERFGESARLEKCDFKDTNGLLDRLKIGEVDGVIYDLGVSSFQLEEKERGFSLKLDGPLDMRMDRGLKVNAAYLVNKLDEEEIAGILREYGEERFSGRIAHAIVRSRPVKTTRELAGIVERAMPVASRHGRIHPATRTFQALRIAVNDELGSLDSALGSILGRVKRGGRICVISFHSLEDRIVKNSFREQKRQGVLKLVTKKPVRPDKEELQKNPRSRSAKLRVAERL